ncbi:AraC family transcriptional regulator ligand-binding domain-containing protein [Bacterioplanoides sp.]|uniref:AraC family transcriptional regulator n=1 Tax=Bacterioplanoides sp. TaxID=2066072 RepID=UPI003B5C9254
MKRASKFVVSPGWKVLLNDMQIDLQEALAHARLPADLFHREQSFLTPVEYFSLWQGIEYAAGDRPLAMLLAENMSVESFDAPIFAAICSPDLNTALTRISQYKPLIGPMIMDIRQDIQRTELRIRCYGYQGNLPEALALTELVFFTQLGRLATRQQIIPEKVILPELPADIEIYQQYFGCPLSQGDEVAVFFAASDASRPFMTSNAAMWDFFEAGLNQKLADLNHNANTTERVKAVLMEALPAGQSSAEYVAERLAMSKRTLQRKLTSEAETFQSVLQAVRAELADHYLQKSNIPLAEISFLLGFQEANSFIRAFTGWKGVSPGSYREQQH